MMMDLITARSLQDPFNFSFSARPTKETGDQLVMSLALCAVAI
jgi:hypothetical protein